MADEDLDARIMEICMDSDSDDEEFLGFEPADLRRERVGDGGDGDNDGGSSVSSEKSDREAVPDGYSHEWLIDFADLAGPSHVDQSITQSDLFRLFITNETFDLLVVETNRYAEQVKAARGQNAGPTSRVNKWKPVTFEEMKAFVAILLLIGLTKRSSFELYWSTDKLIEMPGFRNIMSRERFLSILSFFHLVDNTTAKPRDHPEHDKAFKIRSFLQLLLPS